MKDSYVYNSILDLISYKELYYKCWNINGDVAYSYTYIGDVYDLIKSYHTIDDSDIYDFILDSIFYINQPFIINITKNQYDDLKIYDQLLEIHPMILEDLYFAQDPFNDNRLFIVYFNDKDFNHLYTYDANELSDDYFYNANYIDIIGDPSDLLIDYCFDDFVDYYFYEDDILSLDDY